MLEIYNEQVNDLLAKKNLPGGLQVRQHPSQGFFYAQDLCKVPVGSYKEIEQEIEKGTARRSVASTMMNATSSRAHTVVTITFDQIFKSDSGNETKKSSVINLVDLAGSERNGGSTFGNTTTTNNTPIKKRQEIIVRAFEGSNNLKVSDIHFTSKI